MEYKGVEISIKKETYQKANVQDDNKTYIIDDKLHTLYSVEIHKNYYTENKEQVLNDLLNDLEGLCKDIKEKLKEQER